MGEVYRADDLTLDQQVALKFLPEKVGADPGSLGRFHNEVRMARQVSHPNVCRIYDIGQVDHQQFISMEYVDGEDLASLLRRIGRLPNDKALEIAQQMCAGLSAAHDKGVLHRDFKPANIMIDGLGKVRIADFGLARGEADGNHPTAIEGTPAYMAPEQFAGKGESVKSDIYSLGLVLYEMFTGKPAFKAPTVSELARLHRESNPTQPSIIIPGMDPVVERVILRCLEKDPALRPASPLAVAAGLPGGDPLAAALALGETPSPEMVAAAGDTGALKVSMAWAGLGYILLALVSIALLSGRTSLLNWIPQAKGPEALVEKSRELIKALGYTDEPGDSAYGFMETDFPGRLGQEANRSEQLKLGEPPAMVFWYRQSPDYLANPDFYHDGVVRQDNPPQKEPGMIRVQLDPEGKLVKFDAVPPSLAGSDHAPTGPDWKMLLSAAGFDQAKLKPETPEVSPPVFADSRAAWQGVYSKRGDISIRIEAAAAYGKPVFFRIFQPWNRPSPAAPHPTKADKKAINIILSILLIAILAAAVYLAWRNLKSNRGDRRGALRISFCLFLAEAAARGLAAHFVPDLNENIGLIWMITSRALFFGLFVWIVYIALEPHIRRLWPHAIISWSRLLAGQVRDPRIGKDLLAGAAFGITIPLLDVILYLIAAKSGIKITPALASIESVNFALGTRNLLGTLSLNITGAVTAAMYMFLLYFILRLILRRDWLAGAFFVVVLTANNLSNSSSIAITLFISLILNVGLLILLRRLGLIAVMASILFINVPESLPVTLDQSLWYSTASAFVLLFLFAFAVYGFRTALAGKPAFAFDLLNE